MFTKPHDLAVMLGIFGLVIITVGFGLTSINDKTTNDVNTSYFTGMETELQQHSSLMGASSDMSEVLGGEEGSSSETSTSGLVVRGINSMWSLGKVFNSVRNALTDASAELGVPAIYWMVPISIILITMGVIIYTWLTGG